MAARYIIRLYDNLGTLQSGIGIVAYLTGETPGLHPGGNWVFAEVGSTGMYQCASIPSGVYDFYCNTVLYITNTARFIGGIWNGSISTNIFPDGATTPDVSDGMAFITANTGPTAIDNFIYTGGKKQIIILINDDNTSFAHNTSKIWLESTDNLDTKIGDTLNFIYDGTRWRLANVSLIY